MFLSCGTIKKVTHKTEGKTIEIKVERNILSEESTVDSSKSAFAEKLEAKSLVNSQAAYTEIKEYFSGEFSFQNTDSPHSPAPIILFRETKRYEIGGTTMHHITQDSTGSNERIINKKTTERSDSIAGEKFVEFSKSAYEKERTGKSYALLVLAFPIIACGLAAWYYLKHRN